MGIWRGGIGIEVGGGGGGEGGGGAGGGGIGGCTVEITAGGNNRRFY